MHRCECNHWRCKKLVSRATWFRHRISTIVTDSLGAESDPLPVEDALPAAVDVQQEADPVLAEVHIFKNILTYSAIVSTS
jgi:hypothetical protein